ncbi:MAG: hypothetical protein ACK452_11970 [Bacteroidota bacterium]
MKKIVLISTIVLSATVAIVMASTKSNASNICPDRPGCICTKPANSCPNTPGCICK